MAVVQVACIHCQQTFNVVKNGKAETGHQRYRCKDCNKSFQLEYRYNGNLPGTHEQIIKMAMDGSGVRDIGRVLEISPATALARLKTRPANSNTTPLRKCPGQDYLRNG